jgi:hemoglobin
MQKYGVMDASYQAAGKEAGIRKLVDEFYHQMQTLRTGQAIFNMHSNDLTMIKDKLSVFLMGWLGGPRNYAKKYGQMSIPMVHKHLMITEVERDAWLFCMKEALKSQDYSQEFKEYLLRELTKPAEAIRRVSQMEHKNQFI